jgi:hypothetical protein
MSYQKDNRHLGKMIVQPFEGEIGSDFLDQTIPSKYLLVLPIDPAIANFTAEDILGEGMELCILRARSHVLKIVEPLVFWDLVRIERLKQDPTRNLGSDDITEPRGAASGGTSHQDALSKILVRIDIKTTSHKLNRTPGKFAPPKIETFQFISVLRILRMDATCGKAIAIFRTNPRE